MSYHFADSAEKLVEGQSLYAICGQLISNPEFKVKVNAANANLLLSLRTQLFNLCQECRVQPLTEQFRYVVSSGKGHSA